jgi:esterase/lipase superfamily enzyme
MPTPNLYTQSASNPFADVAPPFRTNTVDILYATDREPLPQDDGTLVYGYGRSHSLAFGSSVVEMGENLSWDDLVAESRQRERSEELPLRIRSIEEQGRFPSTPLPLIRRKGKIMHDPTVLAVQDKMADRLRTELRKRLALTSRKAAYVFVHGYNNSFEDAAFVIAQLWHFLGRQGVPILYTWPAGAPGALKGYGRDRESGEFTIFHLKQFGRVLASTPELEQIHVIAHSRGTDVVTTALRELIIEARAGGREHGRLLKVKNLVLAAADLDFEVLTQRLGAEEMGLAIRQITVYVSKADKAIGFSGCLFVSLRRLGQLRPEDLTDAQRQRIERMGGVQIIDARVPTGFVGHSYFYTHPAVSADLVLLLRHNYQPGSEGRPLRERGANFWEIVDGYPGGAEAQPQ